MPTTTPTTTTPRTTAGATDSGAAAVARRFVERVLGANDMAVADEVIAEDFVYHSVIAPQAPLQGRAAFKPVINALHGSFPDVALTVEQVLAADDGEHVTIRFTAAGTHRGSAMFDLAPTGRRVTMIETHVVTVRGGQVVEDWAADNNTDFQSLFAPVFDRMFGRPPVRLA